MVEQKLVDKFLEDRGKNPACWPIPIDDKYLKEISIEAFRQLHSYTKEPGLIFYEEETRRRFSNPSMKRVR